MGFDDLPEELLELILSFLTTEPPSVRKVFEEPSLDLPCSDDAPLKRLSLVSKQLRRIVFPLLLEYSRVALSDELVPFCIADTAAHEHSRLFQKGSESVQRELSLPSPDQVSERLRFKPFNLWFPCLPSSYLAYIYLLRRNKLHSLVKSLVVYTAQPFIDTSHMGLDNDLLPAKFATRRAYLEAVEIWTTLFSSLDPERLIVVAPPSTLAAVFCWQFFWPDAWAFAIPFQSIELRRQGPRESRTPEDLERFPLCLPFHPLSYKWSEIALNDGSFLSAYSTYEYFYKRPPLYRRTFVEHFWTDMVLVRTVIPFLTQPSSHGIVKSSVFCVTHLSSPSTSGKLGCV